MNVPIVEWWWWWWSQDVATSDETGIARATRCHSGLVTAGGRQWWTACTRQGTWLVKVAMLARGWAWRWFGTKLNGLRQSSTEMVGATIQLHSFTPWWRHLALCDLARESTRQWTTFNITNLTWNQLDNARVVVVHCHCIHSILSWVVVQNKWHKECVNSITCTIGTNKVQDDARSRLDEWMAN